MSLELYTIGHSTHPFDAFIALLTQHQIELLADIRRFPGSRKFPHFGQDYLAASLPAAGITYEWFETLGGRRKQQKISAASKNVGLRNESFRNYADYMATAEFRSAVDVLLDRADKHRTAYMCSESVFWRCHRRLVSDYLTARGFVVHHIMPSGDLRPHTLTTGAVIVDGEINYPPDDSDQARLLFD